MADTADKSDKTVFPYNYDDVLTILVNKDRIQDRIRQHLSPQQLGLRLGLLGKREPATVGEDERPATEKIVIKPEPVKIALSLTMKIDTSSDDDRLDRLGPFIPKPWREGWLHDILEDRENWRADGLTRRTIAFRTATQFANAMIFNPRTWFVGAATWIVSKMSGPWFGG